MNAAEMHAFEQAMMEDPLLADAVDGYQSVANKITIETDLAELKKRLDQKKGNGQVITGFFRPWMSVAAGVIILLATAVVLVRFLDQPKPTESIVVTDIQQKDTATAKETVVDSNTIALNEMQPVKDHNIAVKPQEKKQPVKNVKETETQSNNTVAATDMEPMKNAEVASAPPPSPAAVAAIEKKQQAETFAKMESKAKTKTPTLNKFTGVVVDENNNPLPFANITEVKSGVGTYADVKGNFTLIAADSVLAIETKSVGYSTANIQLRNNNPQQIVLKDEAVMANAPTRDQLYERNKKRASAMKEEITEMESEPADGWNNYSTYVLNNLRMQDIDDNRRFREREAKKEVEVSFDVNPDGSIANIKVERSTCKDCNREAIRLIKDGPKWKSKTGKTERARFTVQF